MSRFKNFLENRIRKDQVDPKEAEKLGQILNFDDINTRVLRSGYKIPLVTPAKQSFKKGNFSPTTSY